LDPSGPTPVIHQGTIIPVSLLGEINSDLPGQFSALVTIDVYDSISGEALLIPKGSKLVGRYNNDIRPGQERVMSAFTRLIRPDGSSIDLGGMASADALGQAGTSDEVDNHFWKMFSSSFLIGGVAWLFEKDQPSSVVTGNNTQSFGREAGRIFGDVARTILERNRNIPPTLIIRKGHKFTVQVSRDIAIPPYRQ
jgi:type IV secretion system protein VirB10